MSQEGFDKIKKECINSGLCFECGACSAVCPTQALQMKRYEWGYNPELCGSCKEESCDLCSRACAGRVQPQRKVEEKFFGRAANAEERKAEIGVVRNFYTGYTNDPVVREHAVSGGIITSVILNGLEQGLIDGAVVAGWNAEKPWIGEAHVVRNREELLACSGSMYQPHPQLLGLRKALDMGLQKIAITATPCAAASLRKMMLDEKFADIRKRIKVIICNFCAAHWSRYATEWLITEKMKLKLEDVKKMLYRARPFPGMFKVWLKDGTVREEKFVYGFLNHMGRFTPEECRYCLDKVAYNADLAVGDTWGHPTKHPSRLVFNYDANAPDADPFLVKAKDGISQFLTRSEVGEEMLQSAIDHGYLTVCKESEEIKLQVISSVAFDKITSNKNPIAARERRGMPVRDYQKD